MRKDFVNSVSEALGIGRKDLVEKDVILHQILLDLSKDGFFSENFLFKGVTCLIKCYLGYFRFSEDMDFTWKNQAVFRGKSQKEVRRSLSGTISQLGKMFETIADERGLDFRCEKNNTHYVELGGGNKTVTFKLWYAGSMNLESFVKVQINFLESVLFPGARIPARTLLSGSVKAMEASLLFPKEYAEYSRDVALECYDAREIMCEKIRAILTRRGTKARDFVDCYLIAKRLGIRPESLEEEAKDKVMFMLELYGKYRDNIREKISLLDSGRIFSWGEEKGLLLSSMDEKDFYGFMKGFTDFLRKIAGGCLGMQHKSLKGKD